MDEWAFRQDTGAVMAALDAGDDLGAADLAGRLLATDAEVRDTDGWVRLAHARVLALARAGASGRAVLSYVELGLAQAVVDDRALAVDVAALGARLQKDAALAVGAPADALVRAADAYADVGERFGAAYAWVNAATLSLLAGDQVRAQEWATRARAAITDSGDYWSLVTEAEAALVEGDHEAASRGLVRADAMDVPAAHRAATRRQLFLLADRAGRSRDVVDQLTVPGVLHYCGHMLTLDAQDEASLRGDIESVLGDHGVGVAVGSLACGGDVLVAEAVLARGGQLHVVLPFDLEDFLDVSVRPGGVDWEPRLRRCLDGAVSVEQVTMDPWLSDLQFAQASVLAMGQAVLHADTLTTTPVQLAVWDGVASDGPAGTGADVRTWRATGRDTIVVAPRGHRARTTLIAPTGLPPREVRAVLFADVEGFSRLADHTLPVFFAEVMGRLGQVLDGAGDRVEYRNTWGDGLYVVCRDVASGAEVACALQEAMRDLGEVEGLPTGLGLRLGAHAGPVYLGVDPVRHEPTFFGRTVTRAARIEPRTPPGQVYVTEDFAALLRMSGADGFDMEYVGRVPLAKSAGSIRMRLLRRA